MSETTKTILQLHQAGGPKGTPWLTQLQKIFGYLRHHLLELQDVTLVGRPTWLQTMFGYRSDMVTKLVWLQV